MSVILSQCLKCRHLERPIQGPGRCSAFPEAIPAEIMFNDFDHRKPYPNDNGIRFEPREEEARDKSS